MPTRPLPKPPPSYPQNPPAQPAAHDELHRRLLAVETITATALQLLKVTAELLHATNHRLERAEGQIMATKTEVTELVSEFNEATNAVEVRLGRLEELAKTAGLNETEEAEFFTTLRGVRTRLRTLGADPVTPIPPDPIPPTA